MLVLIASFLPWYGYDYHVNVAGFKSSGSASINAWHGWALFGVLLVIAATALAALAVIRLREIGEPMPWAHRPAADPPTA